MNKGLTLEEIYCHYDYIHNRCSIILGINNPDLDDLTMDIIHKIHRYSNKLEKDEAFFGWMRVVARNHVFDYLRRRNRITFISMDSGNQKILDGYQEARDLKESDFDEAFQDKSDIPEDKFFKKVSDSMVRDSFDVLSDIQKKIVEDYYMGGQTLGKMAIRDKIPAGTVKSRASRSRKRLKKELLSSGYYDE